MPREVWDAFTQDFAEMPAEMEAFLQEIEAVCHKHGLSLGHEDTEGGFEVHLLKEKNIQWVNAAAKRYTHEVDPVSGIALTPSYMGDGCSAAGIACLKCRYKDYCYPEWDSRAQEQVFSKAAKGIQEESDPDQKIEAAESYIIQKHMGAWEELAKGE